MKYRLEFLLIISTIIPPAWATEEINLLHMSLAELMNIEVNVGKRGKSHLLEHSLVPTDIITADEIRRTGYGELGKVLQLFLPSFNFPAAALADGTDHARPFTLRGLSTDQVLVLINGKRRHAGALLHLNATIGRGSTGVDINMIPLHAIKRIEVLRDGAAAQYGSDAIAGIINIVLKDQIDHSTGLTLGQTTEGDGNLSRLTFATGILLADNGFIRFDGEMRQRGATNRSGIDSRTQYFEGDPRNNQPSTVTHQLGDAQLDDLLLLVNAEIPKFLGVDFYGYSSYGKRSGDATGFFRRPLDNRTVRAIYPDGFLPHIVSDIRDFGLSLGAKSITKNGWNWDLSYTMGLSSFHFSVDRSLNTSLGVQSPRRFDAGTLSSEQGLISLDLFKSINLDWKNLLDVAAGLEWRNERFEITPGEADSWRYGGVNVLDGPNTGSITSPGAQVFPGFKPVNETDVSRRNLSAYLDLEYSFSPKLRIQSAARYEHSLDFNDRLNGKLAGLYTPNERWTLRASAGSGFRAPSLAQSHFTSTATVFVENDPVEIGTFSVNHPLSQALGAENLEAEKSIHGSAGFSFHPNPQFLLSLDFFYTRINDRIILSGDIVQNSSVYGQNVVDALKTHNVLGARFFSNAIDTKTQGLDFSIKHEQQLARGQLSLAGQYHFSKTQIIGDVHAPQILGENGSNVILNRFERIQRVESGQPGKNVILSALYQYDHFDFSLRFQRFGSYRLVNYLADANFDQTVSAKWLTSFDISYHPNRNLELALGAHNIFDIYPDANQGIPGDPFIGEGKIIPYSPNAPFGYNGAFYYARIHYNF